MPDLSTFGYNVLANLVALSPVESVVIWLIWTTRKSARRASAMSELLPWSLRRFSGRPWRGGVAG